MPVTLSAAAVDPGEEQVVLQRISWDAYEKLNDEVGEGRNPRMIYCDGKLTIMVTSRKHDWHAERLGQFVVALAEGLQVLWEDAGQATFRRKEMNAGREGGKTFYLGENAELMKGPTNIDLMLQPPPDLAIEVEVSHSADAAMVAWGRLGVPELWRFDPVSDEFGFWLLQKDGTYNQFDRGLAFPTVTVADVVSQMHLAKELGSAAWHVQLREWVRNEVEPRVDGTS